MNPTTLLGRVLTPHGAPLDNGPGITDLLHATPATGRKTARAPELWHTGIKVIDVYAPIARGSTVAIVASPGVGLMVMSSELIYRLHEQRGGCAVFAELDSERVKLQETTGQLREAGVFDRSLVIGGQYESSAAERVQVLEAACASAHALLAQDHDVLLIIDDGLLINETAELLRTSARATATGSVTIVLCFWRHTGAQPELDPAAADVFANADVTITLSRTLAKQAIWPAVDALASRSRFLDATHVPAAHVQTAEQARTLLQSGPNATSDLDRARAEKLLLFQAQPFFVAEPFTARPAEYVAPAAGVEAFAGILSGAYDHVPNDELQFIGGVRRPTLT